MNEIEITREDTETKARYVARIAGVAGEGELTLSKLSEKTIIADHTATPDTMRGMGVARALVERLVTDAREAGQTVVPLCPYVRGQAHQNREAWADVIQF